MTIDPSTSTSTEPAIQAAVAGEALIDLIRSPDGRYLPCLGGALYNLSRALSRQGVGTRYLNPLSRDRFGRELAAQLRDDGVQLAHETPVQQVTSLAVVNLDASGHPDYAFYREGVADRAVSAAQLGQSCDGLPALQLACTGALALDARDRDVYLPWLAAQRSAGRCVVVDANLRPSVMPDLPAYRAAVRAALAHAHVIKVSDEDLAHLDAPGSDPLDRARRLLAVFPQAELLALTLGPDGAWLLHRDGREWRARESAPLTVVDTVGAGDCFFAGLLAHLLRQSQKANDGLASFLAALPSPGAAQALAHGLAGASLCVQAQGCVPPSWSATRDWAHGHPARSD